MQIEAGVGVTVHYTLTVNDRVIDATPENEPLFYVQGEKMILPGVEAALEGLHAGEKRRIVLPPDQGFGRVDPSLMREVDRACFPETLELKHGDVVDAHDADGVAFRAKVNAVNGDVVLLDCNHLLAGQTLVYDVEILKIEKLNS